MSTNAPDLGSGLKTALSSTDKLLSNFKQLDKLVGSLSKKFNSLGSSTSGSGNTGAASGFNIGGGNGTAAFSGLAESASQNFGQKMPIFGEIMRKVGVGIKVAGSISNMMPDVNATMTRMSQGYNAAVMNGFSGANNETRAGLQRGTLAMMGNGLTSAGSDMQVANIMAASGISYNADPNSTYATNVRTTANVSKYLNIDNATAAQSMANLTSGATSSNLMRNFGISTYNARTGKERSFGEIAGEFERMISKGGKFTAEQVMSSYHQGGLGVSLAGSGLDDTQQQMILQDLMSKANTGKGIDFSNTEEMDRLAKDNPMLSQYKLAASDTKQMQKGEGAYKTGIDAAVGGLTALNDIAGDLAATFGSLKSGIDTFTGHRAGAGAVDFFSNFLGFFGGGSQTMGTAFASGGMSGMGGLSGNYTSSSRGGGDTSTVTAGDTGGGGGGGGAVTTSNGSSATNGKKQISNKKFTCIKPVKGGRVIAEYGIKGERWNGGIHKALDWDVKEGTQVVAAHDGIVHTFPNHSGSEVGNYIRLWYTGNGQDRTFSTGYAHLSSFDVADGTSVKQGDPIGKSGRTGTNCDGPHLHFEVWRNGQRVNPHDYINGEASGNTTSSSNDSGRSTGGDAGSDSSVQPRPIALTASNAVSSSNGVVSGSTGANYYSSGGTGGGGTSSSIGVDSLSGGAYASSRSATNYLTVGGSSGQSHPLLGGTQTGSSKPNVVINLTIGKATDAEAKFFAGKVKAYLEEETLLSNMGRI